MITESQPYPSPNTFIVAQADPLLQERKGSGGLCTGMLMSLLAQPSCSCCVGLTIDATMLEGGVSTGHVSCILEDVQCTRAWSNVKGQKVKDV